MSLTLSPDQLAARDIIHARLKSGKRFVVLAGAAGTGKTTVLKQLLEDFSASSRGITLMAPTAKAALRMSEVTGRAAVTVHSQLYARVIDSDDDTTPASDEELMARALTAATRGRSMTSLSFTGARSIVGEGELAVIDEASMIGSRVHKDIEENLAKGAQVLYLGDHAQLQPVKDTWGANLLQPDALLERVHRQALDNPILAYATAIREHRGTQWLRDSYDPSDWRLQIVRGTRADVIDYVLDVEARGYTDSAMLTWMNDDRRELNSAYRQRRGFDAPVCVGDRIRVRENETKLGYVNGEVRTVAAAHREPRATPSGQIPVSVLFEGASDRVMLVPSLFEDDVGWRGMKQAIKMQHKKVRDRRPYLQGTYGHCLTAHTAQGSQFDVVHAYLDPTFAHKWHRNAADGARLLYTIATRATQMLRVIACVQ